MERAQEYQIAADTLRGLALLLKAPEVRAELLWLAQSYERLAADTTTDRIVDGFHSLEVPDQQITGALEAVEKSAANLGT